VVVADSSRVHVIEPRARNEEALPAAPLPALHWLCLGLDLVEEPELAKPVLGGDQAVEQPGRGEVVRADERRLGPEQIEEDQVVYRADFGGGPLRLGMCDEFF
jgi:hypothetical protein